MFISLCYNEGRNENGKAYLLQAESRREGTRMTDINPQAEPFFLPGSSELALLFLHGFTASPSEIYPVARLIHEQSNCTVSAILLPGHGSSPELLNNCSWLDWYGAVKTELDHLLARYTRVFVGGLSMGALLALNAGLKLEGLQGVVAINAPIFNRNPFLTTCAPLYGYLRPYYPKKNTQELYDLEEQGRFAYRVMPVKAFQSLMKLRAKIMQDVQQLKIPALIIQSLQDDSVHPRSGQFLFAKTRANGATLLELKSSRHIATMGAEKEDIAQAIIDFMNKRG